MPPADASHRDFTLRTTLVPGDLGSIVGQRRRRTLVLFPSGRTAGVDDRPSHANSHDLVGAL